jgi:mannose-1-phosphate guanylyltransferase/mannose-6-phosphate isomerase
MLIPVILSGGAGTRLWPASRQAYPKPFMRLGDGHSLLFKTLERALACLEAEQGDEIVTVTAQDHYFLTRDEFATHPDRRVRHRFLLEPAGRNTAPALVLAALDAQARHGSDAILLVLPADHLIRDIGTFVASVRDAQRLAADGFLVTFGLRPTHPETGFGYIHAGAAIAQRAGREIAAFREKPDRATAEAYVASGEHYWNSGMFCFSAGALIAAAADTCPDVLAAARACIEASDADAEPLRFERNSFIAQPDISIDYAVMERASRRAVVPAAFDWSDIGSWKSISELDAPDARGNRVRGAAVLVESDDCYVEGGDRVVAAVGVRGLVIVDTGDAVLVADRASAQSVRTVVERLREAGHSAATHHRTVHRPWGSYTVLEDADDCKVKRLTVKPGGILSLQRHQRRSEHWTVVAGTARVRVGDDEVLLERNQSTYIPMNTLHRLENPGTSDLHLIETQCGDYFGEDDIERLEDVYGRK